LVPHSAATNGFFSHLRTQFAVVMYLQHNAILVKSATIIAVSRLNEI